MEMIEINNQQYALTIHQKGSSLPYLLMLHGFMGDQRVFSHLIDAFSDFCNPITIDLLGHGQSSTPFDPNRYHEDKQVSDIFQLIQKLSIFSVFLYGYSMGGRLALQLASKHPDQFKGLILESTNAGIEDPQQRKQRKRVDTKRAKKITDNFQQFLKHWTTLDLFETSAEPDEALINYYHNIQSEQSPSALAASLKGFGTGTMTSAFDNLTNITLPTLLIAGSADSKYQRINQNLSKKLPNATFSSIKAGHRVHLDNPPALVEKIKNFITSI